MFNPNFSDFRLDVAEYFRSLNSTWMIASILPLLIVIPAYRSLRTLRTPRLQGPRSESFILGIAKKIFPSANLALIYQDWERIYGPVYEIPLGFGSTHVVLSDPKALTHLFSKDTITYHQPARQKAMGRKLFGDILVLTEGEVHKRLRRVLSSSLTVSAIRNLTPACLDSVYELKVTWDSCFQSSDQSNNAVLIDAQKWMNCLAMDNIGKAVLSLDFGNLGGHTCSILAALDAFHAVSPSGLYIRFILFTAEILYALFKVTLPNAKEKQFEELAAQFKLLTSDFMVKARKEPEDSAIHQSILGVLLKAETANSNIRLSLPEIMSQTVCNFCHFSGFSLQVDIHKGGLVLAGYETTAIALTWCIIELARRPEIQETLRAELREYLAEEERPTYDQLTKDLKYLDAFISEILRFHPSETQLVRVAAEDDMIPLTDPIRTASGAMIDSLFVRKDTVFRIPLGLVNISEALWGPNAGTFDPDRWLDVKGHKMGKKENLPGYRNLLTFGAGPRLCPGRDLSLLEMKAALSVLVRHFTFEFPNGPSTELSWQFGRPKVAGEDGPKVPILVRRLT